LVKALTGERLSVLGKSANFVFEIIGAVGKIITNALAGHHIEAVQGDVADLEPSSLVVSKLITGDELNRRDGALGCISVA
jgi:hypothetical protein